MVRNYTDEAVDPGALDRILEAAQQAPSAGFSQGQSVIVITDPDSDRYHTFGYISWWKQDVVRNATILVAGAGALGNEVIKNLALMGIGNLVQSNSIANALNSTFEIPHWWTGIVIAIALSVVALLVSSSSSS